MPHRPWHTGNPFFGGGMYGGEEEFDLPALFAASPQLGNLSPEIAANAISSAVQQISAPASSPFQDFVGMPGEPGDIGNVPVARPTPMPVPAPPPTPSPPPPLLGGISGGMMDMPVPPAERPFLGGMGGGSAPMDMNVPIGPEPPPSAPMLTPEQMREIGLRSALQKTGLGSVPFDAMSEVGPMGQDMTFGGGWTNPARWGPEDIPDKWSPVGVPEYPVRRLMDTTDPSTIRNLMQIAPTGLGFAGEPAGFRGTVPGQAAVSPQMAELESGSFPQAGLGTMTDVGGMQGELGAFGTGGGSLREGITGPITDRWLRSRDPQFEEFFDESVRGTPAAQAPVNEAAVAANKKLAQVTQAVMDNPSFKKGKGTNEEAEEVAVRILAEDPQGVTSTTAVERKLKEVRAVVSPKEEVTPARPSVVSPKEEVEAVKAVEAVKPLTVADQRRADAIAAAGPGGGFPGTGGPLDEPTVEPSTKEEKDAIQKEAERKLREQKAADAAAAAAGYVTTPSTTTEVISEAAKKEADAAAAGNGAKFTGYPVSSSVDIDPTTNLPFGQDTAAGANLAAIGGAGGPTSLWQQSLSPFEQWQQWRMAPYGGATLGGMARGMQSLGAGYQPAYGRFLLGSGQGGYEGDPMDTGAAFRQYLEGDRRGLGDVRSSYGSLAKHLGGYGGTDWSSLSPAWSTLFDPGSENYRSNILSASQAALGMSPGFGQQGRSSLGNIYDVMQTQYGPEGAGKFSEWVSSAYA